MTDSTGKPTLHGCPDCHCPLPAQGDDPRFQPVGRLERWAWRLLGLTTGHTYGRGPDGSYRRFRFGRPWILARIWSGLPAVGRYRRYRNRLLAGPAQPCGCQRNRFTGTRIRSCTEHLFQQLGELDNPK